MDTYVVRLETPRGKLQHKVLAALLFGGTFFVLRFCWSLLSPTSSERGKGLLGLAIEIGVVSLIFGIGMSFFRPRTFPNYKLLVNQDSVTGVTEYTGWMRWLVTRRTVRKGKVRSIFEIHAVPGRPGGIGISERSILGARMWGFVYVPNTLPEYGDLTGLAESWRVAESAN